MITAIMIAAVIAAVVVAMIAAFVVAMIAAFVVSSMITAIMVSSVIAAIMVSSVIAAFVVGSIMIDGGVIHVRIAYMSVAVEVDMLFAVRVLSIANWRIVAWGLNRRTAVVGVMGIFRPGRGRIVNNGLGRRAPASR